MAAQVFRENPPPAPLLPIESIVVTCAHTPRDGARFERNSQGLRIEIERRGGQQSAISVALVISDQDWAIILPALQELMKQKAGA